jgi:pheromone a factor receptor
MYHIWTKRREIKSILASSVGSPGYNHYNRLFMLSGIDIAITIPFNIWYFTTVFQAALPSWPGWKSVHGHFSQIEIFTTAVLNSHLQVLCEMELTRWTSVLYGFLFFLFFGVGAEARKHYLHAWYYISKIFCLQMESFRGSSRYA